MFKYLHIGYLMAAALSCGFWMTPAKAVTALEEGKEMQKMKPFVHTVLFWLKEDASESQRRQLIDDCKSLLGSISTVQFLAVGKPAGTPRDVVDNSYGVGLVVHFADEAGHDYYQEAEKHLEFIERNRDTWQRVQVYDLQTE